MNIFKCIFNSFMFRYVQNSCSLLFFLLLFGVQWYFSVLSYVILNLHFTWHISRNSKLSWNETCFIPTKSPCFSKETALFWHYLLFSLTFKHFPFSWVLKNTYYKFIKKRSINLMKISMKIFFFQAKSVFVVHNRCTFYFSE